MGGPVAKAVATRSPIVLKVTPDCLLTKTVGPESKSNNTFSPVVAKVTPSKYGVSVAPVEAVMYEIV